MFNRLIIALLLGLSPIITEAYPITSYLEMVKESNVGNSWRTLSLSNTYTNPVVACTYNLPSSASNEAVVRVQIVGSNIQVKAQPPNNAKPVTSADIYCTVSEAGAYTIPIKYEAHRVDISTTNYGNTRWGNAYMKNVSSAPFKTQSYSSPVVTGQVMSYSNSNFSTFWSSRCDSRASAPTNVSICIGKHTGMVVTNTPEWETLGYFIAESGEYTLANSYVKIALGSDKIRGVKDSPAYTYALPRAYSYTTATQTAMDGVNGSWAVLYGASPVSTSLNLAVDEETVAGDTTRKHTSEQVAYWVMQPIVKTYANLKINEVMYRQSASIKEFIEFSVLSSGTLLNYLISSQDGPSQSYRLPDINVNTGDYVIFHSGSGTNSSSGGVHNIFSQGGTAVLQNTADDIVLLKPSNTDTTTLNGSGTFNVVPVDYMTYGTGGSIDPIPVSANGVTLSWNSVDSGRLGGTAVGESMSLTPNSTDSDTSVCWEKTGSGDASACPGFIITRDTDASSFINSRGKDNTLAPRLSLSKTLLTAYDPYNGASNPKAIPGAVLEYIITAKNDGSLAADNNTIKISDHIPANTKLCVATVGHCKAPYFINGSPSSGLSLASVVYSNNAVPPYTYGYPASADAEGADSNITSLKASMNGAFQPKTGAAAPNFQVRFRVIVQ